MQGNTVQTARGCVGDAFQVAASTRQRQSSGFQVFLHQHRRTLRFPCADRVHDLSMLMIVPDNRLTVQGRFAHAFPFVLVANQVHPGNQPDKQGVPGSLGKRLVELSVSFGKRDRVVQVAFHLGEQVLEHIEFGPAAVENGESADMGLECKSRVDQLKRSCVGEKLVCGERGLEVGMCDIGPAAAAGLNQSFVLQADNRLANRAP